MKRKVQSASPDKVIASDRFRMVRDVLLFAIESEAQQRGWDEAFGLDGCGKSPNL